MGHSCVRRSPPERQDCWHENSTSLCSRSAVCSRRLPPPVRCHPGSGALVPSLRVVDRDVEELRTERGVAVDYVTGYRWVQRFTPLLAEAAHPCRHAVGDRWWVDATYVKVAGTWLRLPRDRPIGQVIDVSTLKVELVYRTSFRTREEADLALFRFIDGCTTPTASSGGSAGAAATTSTRPPTGPRPPDGPFLGEHRARQVQDGDGSTRQHHDRQRRGRCHRRHADLPHTQTHETPLLPAAPRDPRRLQIRPGRARWFSGHPQTGS